MTNEELKDWIRIYALEILVVNRYAIDSFAVSPTDPLGFVEKIRQQMIAGARMHAFSGLDPAMSDLASAELEDAVNRLMKMVSGQISEALQARQNRSSS
jgi:hypothetical protein